MYYSDLILFLLVSLLKTVHSQTINPCPDKFSFNPERNQPGRWFGTVRLVYDTELSGVWLRLKFDRPVIQLGNWFGQIKTDDNIEFRLSDRSFQLKPNIPKEVLFFVNYNQRDPPPELVRIILNGRVLCPVGQETTSTTLIPGLGEPITSRPLSSLNQNAGTTTSTYRPFNGQQQNVNSGNFRPTTRPSRRPTTTEYENESDDEFFQGDLSGARPNIMTPSRDNVNDICGTVIARPKPLITHGDLTHEGEFPWHAAIYHSKGVNLVYICGASLINKEYLLTAAHCVTKPRTETPSKIGSMVIYLGKHYLKEWSTKGIQDRRVSKLIIHPEFESETFKNDIAIIKVSEPITVTNYVRPVCLWQDSVELHYLVNQPGTIIGWGYDEDGVITDELHKASMPIVSTETCIYSYPDFFARFTSNTTFCAGYRNGTSACNGDSGSGMVFQKTKPQTRSQVWQLRGIVSLSVALQNQARCNTSHYVVFTDVAKHGPWIKSVINSNRNDISGDRNYYDPVRNRRQDNN
ncbi:CLIP domain-containing serine protease 14D-like [Harmonia axyridis]|uniref:CLIP domain-containing serine protease 14D-like n=1 Tax=Harmonia axyridis TaxID=115357 RepID=UPI001E275515|nr:CLIP domain-containing serine protease 14D-like [Harmonia axyridis]XP_045467075.1 CLIP domain-containing serine protease 14D-like [Harmonia axyridis]XP_045467076.1 CLIP domain-containing serine protease 14D-like [Harmonia axyridis]